jgi:hypothetical protein
MAGTMRTSGSSDINVAPPAIPTSKVARPQGGPKAFFEERAALLSQRASEAAAVAREAVTDAAYLNNVHASIVAKHRKMFLERTFGITSDGKVTIKLNKEFKSVKTYKKYTDMIHVISNVLKKPPLTTQSHLQSRNSVRVTPVDIIMSGTSRLRHQKLLKVNSQAQEVWGHCQPHAQHL